MNTEKSFFLLLPLLLLVGLYLLRSENKTEFPQKGRGEMLQIKNSDVGDLKKEAKIATEEKAREANVEAAKLTTHKLQREIEEHIFQNSLPHYQTLFEKWGISDETSKAVIEIIREEKFSSGAAFVENVKNWERKDADKEMLIEMETENQLSKMQLISLLGEKRQRELIALEDKLKSERARRVNQRQND